MNYQHAFHAGNHTEVFKHAALASLLVRLKKKPTPLAFIDTHAGLGVTDLLGEKARRTYEAHQGILKVYGKYPRAAQPYLDVVRSYNKAGITRYPGSMAIARALLSDADRIIGCELNEEVYRSLKLVFSGDRSVAVHHRDGYEAIRAFVPPRERRGVVFADPPFEKKGEIQQLASAIVGGLQKWPTGVFVAWYPIKGRFAARHLVNELLATGTPRMLQVEFVPFVPDGKRLAGSGLVICNTPWRLDDDLRALCGDLMSAFEARQGHWSVVSLAD